jgi:uncharacterized Zn finger protein (UPF0148 family)
MFEGLIKELKELEGLKSIAIPLHADNEGYIDRECPSEECMYQFKVFNEDWTTIFKDEAVWCPLCGHKAPANSFWTTEQIEQAKEQSIKYIQGRMDKALIDDAREFNRKQPKNAFIRMSLSVKGARPNSIIMPIPATKELELKLQCENCNARYAVIGSAFFCPSCGHNSAEKTFDDSIKKVETKIKNIEIIRKTLSEFNKDEAEITCRSLIESGLGDCVVAFQRFCEVAYKKYPQSKEKIPFNAFQKLNVGNDFWKEIFNEGYENWLNENEYNRLNILFQRRHLLAHCEGIVDERYVQKSGDIKYKIGQRIIVKENDVSELVVLIKKLVNKIREKLKNS